MRPSLPRMNLLSNMENSFRVEHNARDLFTQSRRVIMASITLGDLRHQLARNGVAQARDWTMCDSRHQRLSQTVRP